MQCAESSTAWLRDDLLKIETCPNCFQVERAITETGVFAIRKTDP